VLAVFANHAMTEHPPHVPVTDPDVRVKQINQRTRIILCIPASIFMLKCRRRRGLRILDYADGV
jgi:hypothetical protein